MEATVTYKVRGYISNKGHKRLDDALRILRETYNAALDARRGAYDANKKSVRYYDQQAEMTDLRKIIPELGKLPIDACRSPLRRVDHAFKAFFRRVKRGDKPGYPRFKGRGQFETMTLEGAVYPPVRNGRWTRRGLPIFKIRKSLHLPNGSPISVRITRRGRKVYLQFVYKVEKEPFSPTGAVVGLDMGVASTITTSDGEIIRRRPKDHRRKKRLQRAVARSHKGSNTRKRRVRMLAREHEKIATRSKGEAHEITSALIKQYDGIAVEDLQIKNMTRSAKGTLENPGKNVAAKRGLNREIHEQAWGQIHEMLNYKAEWAGRKFVKVNPRFTSQDCSNCGIRNPKQSEYHTYRCKACGFQIDRDLNAAVNILRSANDLLAGAGRGFPPREPEDARLQPIAMAGVLS